MSGVRPVLELRADRLPVGLGDLPDPPERVFAVGEIPRSPRVAIVGTRAPTPEGADFARRLSSELAARGVTIVSGGAEGIDCAAHLGALEAEGPTVVVGPSSFDHPFPEEHSVLFERIVDRGGAYVSLHERGVRPHRAQFFARNALLVAMSHVVVVVETRLRGGARNAAKWARRIGRPLFVVPGAPWTPTASGSIAELRAGARFLTSSKDVLNLLAERRLHAIPLRPWGQEPLLAGVSPNSGRTNLPPDSGPLDDRQRLEAVLRQGPVSLDEICHVTHLGVPRVQELLLTLTLEGALATHPAGKVSLVTR
jgi:DNA processing protein